MSRFRKGWSAMRSIKPLRVMSRGTALALFLALVVPSIALASPTFPVNLSGTETSPVSSLKIVKNPDGSSDVYGTTFAGWEGGGGPNATGWTASPGLGGAWNLAANYHVAAGSKVGV